MQAAVLSDIQQPVALQNVSAPVAAPGQAVVRLRVVEWAMKAPVAQLAALPNGEPTQPLAGPDLSDGRAEKTGTDE